MSRDPRFPLAAIRDVLVDFAVEGEREEASGAIGYGLTLARAVGAHLTVQSASWRLSGDDTWFGDFDDAGVGVIDRRLDALARSIAARSGGDAAQAGVVCTTEAPSLPYPDIVNRLAARARLHDMTVLDIAPRTHDLDREMIEKALFDRGHRGPAGPRGLLRPSDRRRLGWQRAGSAGRQRRLALPLPLSPRGR